MMKEGGAAEDGSAALRVPAGDGAFAVDGASRKCCSRACAFTCDYFSDAQEAEAYLAQGESQADATLDRRELAAYASVGSLLLNLDEAMTKE